MWPWACVVALTACGRVYFDPFQDGDGGASADGTRPDVIYTTNVMFVTSRSYAPGTFGSLAAADAICQREANLVALPGTYVAWLSTSTTNAIDRISGARGWVRVDGTPFLDQPADLASRRVLSPPWLAADGTGPDIALDTSVATGTVALGTVAANTCSDLTDPAQRIQAGHLIGIAVQFTEGSGTINCGEPTRLYCFGTDRSVALTVPAVSGRRAFLSTPWSPGGGLDGADAHCQADATAAALAGTYRALLATDTASAASRFSDGLPWVRLDGVPLAPTAQALLTGYIHNPLNLDALMQYQASTSILTAWLGAHDPPDIGVATCENWTSTTTAHYGTTNRADRAPWLGGSSFYCNDSARLYCLEP